MADKNIQEGDEVSWNWGNSEPSGTVVEMVTEGKLEIESKGKLVHKNADPSNPAVHVERTGNDVVKRASELTKLGSSADGDPAEAPSMGETVEARTTEHQGDPSEKDKQQPTGKQSPKKRAPRKKSNAAAATGEKRAAEEAAGGIEGAGEDSTGKKGKKAKTTKAGDGSEKKGSGRPRKDPKASKAQAEKKHTEGTAIDIDANVVTDDGTTATKKKTPGRPKKSDASDHPPTENVPVDGDAPAANTRSKD